MHKGQATGYPTQADMGATEDAASRRPARPGGPCFISKRVLRLGPVEVGGAGKDVDTRVGLAGSLDRGILSRPEATAPG